MMESHRRAGYYEFKAYTQPLSNGKHQGFVLVRQHTLVGMQQSVFRAGRPSMAEADAFALVLRRVQFEAQQGVFVSRTSRTIF